MTGTIDRRGRPLRNLRLSVTDRCNLRCQYCMPEKDYVWLPQPDVLTFENRTSGDLTGFEWQTVFLPTEGSRASFGAQSFRGRDSDGNPLADIPPDRWHAEYRKQRGTVTVHGRWEHRLPKTDPGSREQRIDDADLVSAGVQIEFGTSWELDATLQNLLDELYFASADSRAAAAPGRSIVFRLSRRGPG